MVISSQQWRTMSTADIGKMSALHIQYTDESRHEHSRIIIAAKLPIGIFDSC